MRYMYYSYKMKTSEDLMTLKDSLGRIRRLLNKYPSNRIQKWSIVSHIRSAVYNYAITCFRDLKYRQKSIATQISHDARRAKSYNQAKNVFLFDDRTSVVSWYECKTLCITQCCQGIQTQKYQNFTIDNLKRNFPLCAPTEKPQL